jgi:hypothetical protein
VGTVFGFADALEPEPELKGRENPRVILALTRASFDPGQDQEQLSGAEIADLRHAIEIDDWMSLWWERREDVVEGASFTASLLAGERDGRYSEDDATANQDSGFRPRFGLARQGLAAGASYSDYRPFAARATVTVRLEEVNLDSGGQVRGRVTLQVERVEGDPANARSGTIEGDFSAAVIGERVAEKNFETLDLYTLLEVSR